MQSVLTRVSNIEYAADLGIKCHRGQIVQSTKTVCSCQAIKQSECKLKEEIAAQRVAPFTHLKSQIRADGTAPDAVTRIVGKAKQQQLVLA